MKQNEQHRRQQQAIRDQIINMKNRQIPQELQKQAKVAARSACLFYDASTEMMKFLPEPEKERYYVPFGISSYLLRFLSLELSLKALRTLTKGEKFEEKHPLNELFDELGEEGQKMILICSGVERQETVEFLRKHVNAVVDLRYFGKDVTITTPESNILSALNDGSILLLNEFGMRFVGGTDDSDQAKRASKKLVDG